jgi:hypothetical protein
MARKKVLFICGVMNQTTMMHKIAMHLPEYDHYFTPFYTDGFYRKCQNLGLLQWTSIFGPGLPATQKYLAEHNLPVDFAGSRGDYDLVFTCTDLIVQNNIRDKAIILVQEGMTDPENFMFTVVQRFREHGMAMPLWLASTSTTGLSNSYVKFCVASDGYRKHFADKGVPQEKLVVTGIPNYDNCEEYLGNDFPHHDYVLVATSDMRENFRWDNRKQFLKRAVEIADGRQLIFKTHPNEKQERSIREIKEVAPEALIFPSGNTNHMVANCHTLITQFSTVVYLGLALGKQVYSYFDMNELRSLQPIQNRGTSARNIAQVAREYLEGGAHA